MEHCSGGDLFDHIVNKGHICEQEAARHFLQILDTIQYLHSQGICHRDLKPENMLLDSDGNVKLIDFGLSTEQKSGQRLTTMCGSPSYICPEMLSRQPYDGMKADIWAAGVILYAMLCGQLPFQQTNMNMLKLSIMRADFNKIPSRVS